MSESFGAVIDTCVLYPAHLRDTLLRLGERGLYRVLWSSDILEELERSLLRNGRTQDSVDHIVNEMRGAFPDADVSDYQSLVSSMQCHTKDRHVLAAAIRAKASVVITFNKKHFPPNTGDTEVEIIHPDDFLLDLLDLQPSMVIDELRQQAQANRYAPKTLNDLLDALTKAGVPSFASEVRTQVYY